MGAVRWVATLACVAICLVLFFAPSWGAAVLCFVCFVVVCWSFGAFTRDFWIEDDPQQEDERCM